MNMGDVKLFDEAFKRQIYEEELEIRKEARHSNKKYLYLLCIDKVFFDKAYKKFKNKEFSFRDMFLTIFKKEKINISIFNKNFSIYYNDIKKECKYLLFDEKIEQAELLEMKEFKSIEYKTRYRKVLFYFF